MTMVPEVVDPATPETKKFDIENTSTLEDMFYLGYTQSKKMIIYEHDDKKFTVVFRTLLPIELRDIFEAINRFSSFEAQAVTDRIETLARTIITINDMPLVMDQQDKKDFKEYHDRDPSPLEQARYILINKIKSVYIIDALYEAYIEFSNEIKTHFDDIKKKLKNQKSSDSILLS